MSRRRTIPLAVLALLAVFSAASHAAEPSPEAVRLDRYAPGDGQSFFALSLTPTVPAPAAAAHEVVVLFDTSASQTGVYREKSLRALDALLASLTPNDRVHLVAVDVNAIPLTPGFVSAGSADMRQALVQLNGRVPLGSTDMGAAMRAAIQSYRAPAAGARAVVYMGDGMSVGDQLAAADMQKLVKQLVDQRIPVTSYAIGPRIDHHLLGALANHTGGMVGTDSEQVTAQQAGQALAKAARSPVFWPTSAEFPADLSEVYPKQMPPLRTDRDTVLVGVGTVEKPAEVKINAEVAGKPVALKWTVQPAAGNPDNAFLTRLVDSSRADSGIGLSIVGTAGLQQAKRSVDVASRNLGRLGAQALASRNAEQAERLAAGALALDPNNPEAQAVQDAAEKMKLVRFQDPAAEPPAAAPPAALNDPLVLPRAPGADEGQLVEDFDRRRQVIAQKIQADVLNEIDDARRMMATDPAGALDWLKIYEENVRRAPELDADTRSQLLARLQAAMQQAAAQEPLRQQELINAQTLQAAAADRELALAELSRNEQRVEQLMARFNSLMAEQRYFDAEAIADIARQMAPQRPATMAASRSSTMTGYAVEAESLRQARHRGVVDTLQTVERSHIPTPDEPPIIYPSAEFWLAMTERRKEFSNVSLDESNPAEKEILKQLEQPTVLELIETPLADVIDYLKDYHKIEIQLDTKALDDAGLDTSSPITRNIRGISLKSALRLMLKELDLTYLIDNEVLLITTQDEAGQRLSTKVYPVADLVLPVDPTALLGGIGGIGGGGGFGSQGTGGQQGAFGGGGQQGGGFGGGGGGGGGFFNVPDDAGFRAFAVGDDLKLAKPAAKKADPAKPAPTAKPVAGQPTAKPATEQPAPARVSRRPTAISVDLKSKASPDVLWDEHFATNQETQGAVRETVRQLMNKHRFDHVIALVKAALRHRQGQPWMYEVLDLAMQAGGYPAAERERALLSAVDFSDNTADLMYVASYMARTGLDRRALKLFQQVARLEPTRHEPYMHGLAIAQRLKDIEGIQWATVGILSQAWPKQQADMWPAAYRVAVVTLKQLRDEKRKEEADAFEAALNQAMIRDCVAVVSWTGDADIDLMVEEPSGTVCSFRSPRTTSGGIMLGDTFAIADQTPDGGFSEVYVCPQGFDGTYRMLLRRVWGKPTAGKVTVDVYTNYNTDRNQKVRRVISLGSDEALVTFDLLGGRRREPLADRQVANAVDGQLKVRRDILAQQIGVLNDPSTAAGNQVARQRQFNPFNRPFRGGGAVGFQPVITVLPEGANLSATAVISADRRYVRITAIPFFSGISEVNVFNLATGGNTSGQGGTGGQGFGGQGFGQGNGNPFGGGGGGGGGFGGGGGGFGGGGLGGGGGFGGGGQGGGGFGGGGLGGGGQGGGFGGGGAF